MPVTGKNEESSSHWLLEGYLKWKYTHTHTHTHIIQLEKFFKAKFSQKSKKVWWPIMSKTRRAGDLLGSLMAHLLPSAKFSTGCAWRSLGFRSGHFPFWFCLLWNATGEIYSAVSVLKGSIWGLFILFSLCKLFVMCAFYSHIYKYTFVCMCTHTHTK